MTHSANADVVNIVDSIGYSVERLHVGLVAHLVALARVSNPDPLRQFLSALGVTLTDCTNLHAWIEWHKLDLALIKPDGKPAVAFEFKVDSQERQLKAGWQTDVYRKRVPPEAKFLYVTLGATEFFRTIHSSSIRWITLDTFIAAVESTVSIGPTFSDWYDSLKAEQNRRKIAASAVAGQPMLTSGFRRGLWNIYVFAALLNQLEQSVPGCRALSQASAYLVGTRPDTILNLGTLRPWIYSEINANGMLNVKMDLSAMTTDHEKRKSFADTQQEYLDRLARFSPVPNTVGGVKKTKTLVSVPIGLMRSPDLLAFEAGPRQTAERVAEVVNVIYPAA